MCEINQYRRFNSSLGCRAVGMVQPSKFPCNRSQVPLKLEYHEQQTMLNFRKRLKAPPNHSGFNVAEEARIHKVRMVQILITLLSMNSV